MRKDDWRDVVVFVAILIALVAITLAALVFVWSTK